MTNLHNCLNEGVEALDLSLKEADQQRLIQYLRLLEKWNKTFNLTAIRKIEDMVPLHLLDSLSILPFLKGQNFIDVGSGAGLPGLVAAIALRETHWVLLDSNQKKTRFLQQARIELQLDNVKVVHSRVEDYRPDSDHITAAQPFDMAVSRAVASLTTLVTQVQSLCPKLLVMKGQVPDAELDELPDQYSSQVHQVQLPEVNGARSIIILESLTGN